MPTEAYLQKKSFSEEMIHLPDIKRGPLVEEYAALTLSHPLELLL
jgi:hypothetical protein